MGDIPSIMRDLRLDPDGTLGVAEQRALRVILLMRGDHDEVRRLAMAGERSNFSLDAEEMQLLDTLKLVWLDGASAAARAMQKYPSAWQT